MAQEQINQDPSIIKAYSLKDLTELMVIDQGLTEGLYELGITFRVVVGPFALPEEDPFPSVMQSFVGAQLKRTTTTGPHVVDASKISKPKRATKKK